MRRLLSVVLVFAFTHQSYAIPLVQASGRGGRHPSAQEAPDRGGHSAGTDERQPAHSGGWATALARLAREPIRIGSVGATFPDHCSGSVPYVDPAADWNGYVCWCHAQGGRVYSDQRGVGCDTSGATQADFPGQSGRFNVVAFAVVLGLVVALVAAAVWIASQPLPPPPPAPEPGEPRVN